MKRGFQLIAHHGNSRVVGCFQRLSWLNVQAGPVTKCLAVDKRLVGSQRHNKGSVTGEPVGK